MAESLELLESLREINAQAAFNRWSKLEVAEAAVGKVTLELAWQEDFGQYSGFLHAGLIAALIDTACGFAAVTAAKRRVLASHFSVNCLRPAVGNRFLARARVVKAGRSQIFTSCELFALSGTEEKLVATGETILTVAANSDVAV